MRSTKRKTAAWYLTFLLLAVLLDRWFARLQVDTIEQPIDTFIILAPDHFGQYSEQAAMLANSWETSRGSLAGAVALAQHMQKLGMPVRLNKRLKIEEHGLTALLPFIAQYFPNSKVLSLILPSSKISEKFTLEMIQGFLAIIDQKQKNYFLLLSADFSHYQGIVQTAKNDEESKMFLQNPKPNDAQRIHTDNKMGLEILAGLCNYFNNCQLVIDIHTNAWEYTASELVQNNITSYFFVHSIR